MKCINYKSKLTTEHTSSIKLNSLVVEVNRSKRKPAENAIERGNEAGRKEGRNDQELERTDAEANGHGSEG